MPVRRCAGFVFDLSIQLFLARWKRNGEDLISPAICLTDSLCLAPKRKANSNPLSVLNLPHGEWKMLWPSKKCTVFD